MEDLHSIGEQFAHILGGKLKYIHNGCSVSFKRDFHVQVQGRWSRSVVPVGLSFEDLDNTGYALTLGEIALLEEEVPTFSRSVLQQGLIVSAIHNHWILTDPRLIYLHVQAVEPPLYFANKMAHAFKTLISQPIPEG